LAPPNSGRTWTSGGAISPHDIHFDSTLFERTVSFRASRFRVIFFGNPVTTIRREWFSLDRSSAITQPAIFNGTIDLRGLAYDDLHGHLPSIFEKLAPFDRQPYAQLEGIMLRRGDEKQATQCYLARRKAERKNKFSLLTLVPWLFDWNYKLWANYGKGSLRLFLYSLSLLIGGTLVFHQPNALRPRIDVATETGTHATIGQALAISIHYFVPMDIPLGAAFVPREDPVTLRVGNSAFQPQIRIRPDFYASALRVLGTVLVGLGVAAATGLLRRIAR
jgi:hypothetical protein